MLNIKGPTGIEHGTIGPRIQKTIPYEITTLRADVETDGRRAEVPICEKLGRRCKTQRFNHNAMSMDMDGTIYDYLGGMDDLTK